HDVVPEVAGSINVGGQVVNVVETSGIDPAAWETGGLVFQRRPIFVVGNIEVGVIVEAEFVAVRVFEFVVGADADFWVAPAFAQAGGFDCGDPAFERFWAGSAQHGAADPVGFGGGELDRIGFIFVPAAQVR